MTGVWGLEIERSPYSRFRGTPQSPDNRHWGYVNVSSGEGEDLRGQGWKVDKEEGNSLRNI